MTAHCMRHQVKAVLLLAAAGTFIVVTDFVSVFLKRPLSTAETRTSRKAKTPQAVDRWVLTLLVPLSGELGNHLHWISTAYRIKWHLEHKLPLEIQIVGEHQSHRKWKNAQQDILNCFVNLKAFVFDAGRHDEEFRLIRKEQREFVQHYPGEFSIHESGTDCEGLFDCAERRAELAMKTRAAMKQAGSDNSTHLHVEGSHYSLPFLVLREMDGPSINHEEEPIRDLFQLDIKNPFCCSSIPEQSEFVFHLRNFGVESNGRLPARDVSFQELRPDQISLFLSKAIGTSTSNESVAILSRFPDDEYTLSYEAALTAAGYRTRIVHGHSGIQDFCFMLQSTNELFGSLTSTYVWWAAELGNMSATLYSMANRNDTTFMEFVNSVEPHRWRTAKHGSRIRHVPNIPVH